MEIDEFSKLIQGKTVKEVGAVDYDKDEDIRFGHNKRISIGDYDNEGGETVIRFTDGTFIVVWASEWGGITYGGLK